MLESLKNIIAETYMNVCEEGTHKYKKLKDEDFAEIANTILDYDDFWSMIDSFILDELMKYEIGRKKW